MIEPARPVRRILLVEENEDGTVGGSFVALLDLVRRIDRSRFEPVVMFYQPSAFVSNFEALGIQVEVWDAHRRRERRWSGSGNRLMQVAAVINGIWARWRFLRRYHIALVHLNNSPWYTAIFWLPAAVIARIPVIAHARIIAEWLLPAYPTGRSMSATGRRWLARRFHRIVAISDWISEWHRSAGIPASHIRLARDGVDIPLLVRQAGPIAGTRAALGIPADDFVICMVGNVKPEKGQDVLVAALEQLPAAELSGLHVVIAGAVPTGEDAYSADLTARADQMHLGDRFKLLGPRSDSPSLMAMSDVVIHASTTPEPFGLVVAEAMALGRAVIASNRGGPCEIVAAGSGLLFDPADPPALARMLIALRHDGARRIALGEAAARRATEFDVDRTAALVEQIYDEVLGNRQGPATAYGESMVPA